MDRSEYLEQLAEIERQIGLIEEFLRQRKDQAKYDRDLESRLKAYKAERAKLLETGPLEDLPDDIVMD